MRSVIERWRAALAIGLGFVVFWLPATVVHLPQLVAALAAFAGYCAVLAGPAVSEIRVTVYEEVVQGETGRRIRANTLPPADHTSPDEDQRRPALRTRRAVTRGRFDRLYRDIGLISLAGFLVYLILHYGFGLLDAVAVQWFVAAVGTAILLTRVPALYARLRSRVERHRRGG